MIELSDTELESRISLATEVILTSSVIEAEDITKGWYDQPSPTDELQRAIILLALHVICGGLNAVDPDDLVAAWRDHRLLSAAIRAMLTAVEQIRHDANQEAR